MNFAWLYLVLAGFCEVGWPLGFKLSQTTRFKVSFIGLAALSMALSGMLLWLAQKEIPMGTAYAVWTGIGAAGTFLLGILFFGDPVGAVRMLSFGLIVAGVIGLRLG